MNALETLAYIYYLVAVYRHGYTVTKSGRVSQKRHKKDLMWWLKEEKAVPGRVGATALVIAFAAGIATLSKTVLYFVIEFCNGFENVGHNSLSDLILLWLVPNGLWIILPTYMIYVLGAELIAGLEGAAPRSQLGRSKSS